MFLLLVPGGPPLAHDDDDDVVPLGLPLVHGTVKEISVAAFVSLFLLLLRSFVLLLRLDEAGPDLFILFQGLLSVLSTLPPSSSSSVFTHRQSAWAAVLVASGGSLCACVSLFFPPRRRRRAAFADRDGSMDFLLKKCLQMGQTV